MHKIRKRSKNLITKLNIKIYKLKFITAEATSVPNLIIQAIMNAVLGMKSISIFLNSISSETRDLMDAVVGIRPYVFASKTLKSFGERWKRNMLMSKATSHLILIFWSNACE